jgi:hypothetical protein
MSFTPLDPAEFTPSGFTDLPRFIKKRITSCGIRAGEPAVDALSNAVLIPASSQDITASQLRIRGGVLDHTGQPYRAADLWRAGSVWISGIGEPLPAASPAEYYDGEVVYLGCLFAHYGHFLLESLARTWFVPKAPASAKFTFLNPEKITPKGAAAAILERLGIAPDRCIEFDRPTRIRRLICPEALFHLQYTAHPDVLAPFAAIGRASGISAPSKGVVYLSRSRLSPNQRKIVGEEAFEEILRANGVDVAYPETMTLDEQIALFRDHSDVITAAGSAAHNILFSHGRTRLHLLTDERFSQDFFLCSALVGAPTSVINCLETGPFEDFGAMAPRRINPDKLLAHLRDMGIITSAAAFDRSAVSDEALERAWISSRMILAQKRRETLPPEILERAAQLAA